MFEHFDIRNLLLMVVPVLLALTVHEYAHALAAYKLGDNTAKEQGRLTLNPLAHLDPLGTLMLFFSQLFGWAKPVPFNPGNLKNPARDTTLVALAGPVANFITAIAIAILFKILIIFNVSSMLPQSIFLDATKILYIALMINVSIGIFNLLPVPPLDGFKVLSYFLPHRWVVAAYQHSMIFFIAFMALIATGVLQKIIGPVISFVQHLIIAAI